MPNFSDTSSTLGYRIAESVYNDLTANTPSIGYIMIGRNIQYAANDVVPAINDTINDKFDTYNNFLGGKRITGNDVFIVVPRVNWSANLVWTQYDDAVHFQSLSNPYYVYTSNGNVYKCLNNNNGGVSTIEPSNDYTSDSGFVSPGDGYIWKYMYKIISTNKFLSDAWMPAPTSQTPAYFGSANNLVAGAISNLVLVSGGSGYNNTNTAIVITGSGIAANATATITSGVVTGAALNVRGVRYTRQNTTVIVTGAGSGANVRAILPPYGGHGTNPARELGANAVMFSVKIGDVDSTEGGKITANNDFRQVGLLFKPHNYGDSSDIPSANALLAVTSVTNILLTSGSPYLSDELVYQGVSPNTATFFGYVSDVFTNAVQITGQHGTLIPGNALIGNSSGTIRTVITYTNPDLDVESGNLVYIENRSPVLRAEGQSEVIKIVLTF